MPDNVLTRLSQAFGHTTDSVNQFQQIQERRQMLEERKKQLQEEQQAKAFSFINNVTEFTTKIKDSKSRAAYIDKMNPLVAKYSRYIDPSGGFQFSLDPFKTDAGEEAYRIVMNSINNPNDPSIDQGAVQAAIPFLDPNGDPVKGAETYSRLKAYATKVKGPSGEPTNFGTASELVKGSGGGLEITPTDTGELTMGKKSTFTNRSNAIVTAFNNLAKSQLDVLKDRYQGKEIPRDVLLKTQAGAVRTTADLMGLSEDDVRNALSSLRDTSVSGGTPAPSGPSVPAALPTTPGPTAKPTLPSTSSGLVGAPLNKPDRQTTTAMTAISTQLPALGRLQGLLDKIDKEGKGDDIGYLQGQVYTALSKYFNVSDATLEEFSNKSEAQVLETLYEKSGKQTNEIERRAFKDFLIPGMLQSPEQARVRLKTLQQGFADRTLSTLSTALGNKQDVSGNLGMLKSVVPYMTVENADRVYDLVMQLKSYGMYDESSPTIKAFEKALEKNPELYNELIRINKEEKSRGPVQ